MLSENKAKELALKHQVPVSEVRWFSMQLFSFLRAENQAPTDEECTARMKAHRAISNYQAAAATWFVHAATKEGIGEDEIFDLYLALRARDTRPEIQDAISLHQRFSGKASG